MMKRTSEVCVEKRRIVPMILFVIAVTSLREAYKSMFRARCLCVWCSVRRQKCVGKPDRGGTGGQKWIEIN